MSKDLLMTIKKYRRIVVEQLNLPCVTDKKNVELCDNKKAPLTEAF